MLPVNLLFDHSKLIFNRLPIHNIWQAWACFSPASTLTLKLLEAERWLLNTLFFFSHCPCAAVPARPVCLQPESRVWPAAPRSATRLHPRGRFSPFDTSVSTSTRSVIRPWILTSRSTLQDVFSEAATFDLNIQYTASWPRSSRISVTCCSCEPAIWRHSSRRKTYLTWG